MPKCVFVAVDASDASRNAVREAVRLAASLGVALVAVAVVPTFEGGMHLEFIPKKMDKVTEPFALALQEAEAAAKAQGVEVATVLERGTVHEIIVDEAEVFEAEFIVLGIKNRSFLARTLLETMAARVIGYTKRPVLVVPEGSRLDLRTILLAVDGSKYSVNAVKAAFSLAVCNGSALKMVSAVDVPPEYSLWADFVEDKAASARQKLDELAAQATALGLQTETLVVRDDAAKAILDVALAAKVTLIVLGAHGLTGLRRLLMGGVAQEVLSVTPCPVLITQD